MMSEGPTFMVVDLIRSSGHEPWVGMTPEFCTDIRGLPAHAVRPLLHGSHRHYVMILTQASTFTKEAAYLFIAHV
jgi:hypothetical protein